MIIVVHDGVVGVGTSGHRGIWIFMGLLFLSCLCRNQNIVPP